MRRSESTRLPLRALILVTGLLAGCALIPVTLRGVPTEAPWTALPLRSWLVEDRLAEDRAAPEAVAACFSPDCPQRLAVGVFRAAGEEAALLAALLDDPARLARALRLADRADQGARATIRTVVEAAPLRAAEARGFSLAFARADGSRPVHAAALGRKVGAGGELRVVLAIGEEAAAVEEAARRVAGEHLE